MYVLRSILPFLFLALSLTRVHAISAEEPEAEDSSTPVLEVLVTGTAVEQDLTASLENKTALDEQTIRESEAQHFQGMVDSVPNLNWAGGSNRPRFFQVRGIGELEQYEGAPTSSVAFLIDDFDLSSLGTSATLFDVEEVEVLRGPQGFGFGPSALAGLVHLRTKDPTPELSSRAELSLGSDNLVSGGAALSGPVSADQRNLLFRLSAFQHSSDGFRSNKYLDSDDTNRRDELSTRAKFTWLASRDVRLDLQAMHLDLNNGYDAFAIDNSLNTLSDRPGMDIQTTDGASSRLTFNLGERTNLVSTLTATKSEVDYSFDGDWGNNQFWGDFAPYDYFSRILRDRRVASHETRVLTNPTPDALGTEWNWLFGMYQQRLTENGGEHQFQDNFEYDDLESRFLSKINAVFGAADMPIVQGTALTFGLRAENRDSAYSDSRGAKFSPMENMYGFLFGVKHEFHDRTLLTVSASRGYKGGGFNTGLGVPEDRLTFEPEYLWSFEACVKQKYFEDRLALSIAPFYALRRDEQVKISLQDDPNDPLSFTYLTDNAARGHNTGIELGVTFQATPGLMLFSNGALLSAKFDRYMSGLEDMQGRDHAHAPNWQYSTGLRYSISQNLFTRVEVTGKDGFYFDNSNDERSQAYHLTRATLGYTLNNWTWTIWANNLFNQSYDVRGFYFGVEPPDYESKRYTQSGDPRQFGTTISYTF